MQHKTLKLSTLAMLVASATQANAAVYKVVEVDGTSSGVGSLQYYDKNTSDVQERVEFYAQGIESSGTESCFVQSCADDSYSVFGESRLGTDGINYRDEVAFSYDNRQEYNDLFSLNSYCVNNLGFNTCDVWARTQYYGLNYNDKDLQDGTGFGGLHREQVAWNENYYSNAFPLMESSGALSRVDTFAEDASAYSAQAALGDIVTTHETTNGVVNSIGSYSGGDYQLGITSSAFFENNNRYARQFNKRGFVNAADKKAALEPVSTSDALVTNMGQTLAWDAVEYDGQLLVVGSAAFSPSKLSDSNKLPSDSESKDRLSLNDTTFSNCATTASDLNNLFADWECQFSVFANDAVFWTVDGTGTADSTAKVLAERVDKNGTTYAALDPDGDQERSFQASARAVALVDGLPVIAGFSTDSIANSSINIANGDYYAMRASVYTPKDGFSAAGEQQWERKIIPGLDIEQSNDRKLRYTIATDINENNLVVGVGKNFSVENRSYAEKMFVFDNSNDQLKMLDASIDSDIFFSGSNGYPAAINNSDQLVGWVDVESVNQVDGRQRRQRAFTYMAGSDIANSPLKANKAWLIDDLTYSDDAIGSANNAFRIAQATGINDAGVISATAFKCDGGYQESIKESQCATDERVVAVKLIPIPDGTIEARPAEETSITRSGASLGLFALTLLGFVGFRRRK